MRTIRLATFIVGALLFVVGVVFLALNSLVFYFGPCPTFSHSCGVGSSFVPNQGTYAAGAVVVFGLGMILVASFPSVYHSFHDKPRIAKTN
jgi:predicted membrane channel-forming protein YqfA (hemolysin III family)